MRSLLALCALLVALSGFALPAGAADWPTRTLTMVVPFAAGGATDVVGRALANSLGKELGQKVIVKNVSGGNGAVGTAEVAQAKPDGNTIGCFSVGSVALMWQQRKTPYTKDSFIPVGQVGANPTAIHVRPNTYKTLKDLLDAIKKNPGKIKYSSSGPGSQPHVACLMLLQRLGLNAVHVPGTDGAKIVKDLLGGVVDFIMNPVIYAELNDITPLVILSPERDPKFPNVPSLPDTNLLPPGSKFPYSDTWIGVFLPAGTPDPIVKKLEASLAKVMKDPEFLEVSAKSKQTVKWRNAAEFKKFVDEQCADFKTVLAAEGMLLKE